jgi:xylitol oxidase
MRMLAWAGQERLKNWAGNLEYNTDRLYTSISLEQVQDYVKKESKLKVLGTRHCFNNIADSKDGFLSLKPMDKVVAIDTAKRTVTVGAGITYGQLCPYLDAKGFALHNLASLPHISIAGACSTATHGSGQKNGNLATAASALEIVTADGKVVNLSRERDNETFNGVVVGLGALGVITASACLPTGKSSESTKSGSRVASKKDRHFTPRQSFLGRNSPPATHCETCLGDRTACSAQQSLASFCKCD